MRMARVVRMRFSFLIPRLEAIGGCNREMLAWSSKIAKPSISIPVRLNLILTGHVLLYVDTRKTPSRMPSSHPGLNCHSLLFVEMSS